MTTASSSVALLVVLLPTLCWAQAKETTGSEAAIKGVLRQWHESFEKRDAAARRGLLADSTVFFNAFGVGREGKEAVSTFWKDLFATGTFDRSKATVTKQEIRFLTPDIAVVDHFEEVIGQRGLETGRALPPRRIHLTFILTKTTSGWLESYYRAGDLRDLESAR